LSSVMLEAHLSVRRKISEYVRKTKGQENERTIPN
jgi:hypothetical protein